MALCFLDTLNTEPLWVLVLCILGSVSVFKCTLRFLNWVYVNFLRLAKNLKKYGSSDDSDLASSSSSSVQVQVQQKYQVFLSFRGDDTRLNFTSHLREALQRKGIGYFIDDKLKSGGEISHALLTAIQESKISIIVLSKDYVSSSWCLKELSEILDCKKIKEQIVVPIFYHVDPSDVRNQKGKSFEDAFAKHQERFKDRTDMVDRWRAALKEVGHLSGCHITGQPKDRCESEHIKNIVEDISKKLFDNTSNDFKGLVGIESVIKEIESMECFKLVDVGILGIYGMGGIGKTTIAEVIYHRNSAGFEGCCYFLRNVREKSEKYGWICLRDKLLCKILEESNLNIGTNLLSPSIHDRLRRKKVLIVLDDVDKSMQLDLFRGKHCFGPGSRIIVTSRDKQVLRPVVDEIYEVKGLNDDEALQVLSLSAFKQSHPKEGFKELSKKVVHYAKGVPLALSVLGSALYDRSKSFWEDELNKLKEIPNPDIDNILKISLKVLDDEVKDIFLDIACFFKGRHRDYVKDILDGRYHSVMSGISVLIDKSLITFSNNMINMHDLIQQMAWNIICQESKDPGRRSRLWTPKDIKYVLKYNTGTESVESMFLDMSKISGELSMSPTAFGKMHNLRFLKFYYPGSGERKVFVSQQRLESLPDALTFLHWDGYPSKSLPSNFCPENLVELSMRNSHVKRLWNGVQNLMKLKRLDLSQSEHLIEIPNLSRATNLESMKFVDCTRLVEVPSSIRYLSKLSLLDLENCQNLGNFPSGLQLRSLVSLNLFNCLNVTKFPEIVGNIERLTLNETAIEEVPSSIGCLTRLWFLGTEGCKRLKRLPSSICKLKWLNELNLNGCLKLESFPEILETMKDLRILSLSNTSIEELPSSIDHLVGLRQLCLDNSEKLKNLPSSICKLKLLNGLYLNGCSKLESFPEILETMEHLQFLHLHDTSIEELPSSVEHLVGLQQLQLDNSKKLKNLPSSIRKLNSLRLLSLNNCLNITNFPEIPRNVVNLYLSGTAIEQIPSSIECHSKLEVLHLENCAKLGSLPRCIFKSLSLHVEVSDLSKLEAIQQHLGIVKVVNIHPLDGTPETGNMGSNFKWPNSLSLSINLSLNDLVSLRNSIGNMKSLKELNVSGSSVFEELPDNLEILKSLTKLRLSFCNLIKFSSRLAFISSLRELSLSGNNFEAVPASIKQLAKLERLDLSYCKRLQSLPELPPCLERLDLSYCKRLQSLPDLSPRLQYLDAHECTSLEAVSGAFPISPHQLDGQNFIFTNCINLDQKAIWDFIQQMEDVKLHHHQVQYPESLLSICFPGSEIPEWFSCQNLGSSVTIPLPPYLNDHKFLGFALCIVLALDDLREDSNVECQFNFKINGYVHCNLSCCIWDKSPWDERPRFIGSDLVFLVYDSDLYFDWDWDDEESNCHLNEANLEFSVRVHTLGENEGESERGSQSGSESESVIIDSCMVKKCGVHLLYSQVPHPHSESERDAGECNLL